MLLQIWRKMVSSLKALTLDTHCLVFLCSNRRWWISIRLKLWWSWSCLLALFQNLVCRQKIWYSIPFRGGAATTIQMLDDGEVFNCKVERQQLRRCQNMEKHRHSTCISNSKYKPQSSVLLDLFCIDKSSFLEFLYKGLCSASPTLLFFFSFPHLSSNVEINKFLGGISYLCLCNPSPKSSSSCTWCFIPYQLLSPHEPHEDNPNRERTFKETPHKPLWIVTKKASDCFGWLMMSGGYWWSTRDFWTGKKWRNEHAHVNSL